MTLEQSPSLAPLPRWLSLPLGFGILLTVLGLALPWLYPQQSLWTEADAQQHAELATQAHAAHHASAYAQTNKLPTLKEDAAKARYYREQYDLSAERLRQVRDGGSRYGQWLLIAGVTSTALGIIAVWMIRKE
jgi:uncharacterized protein YjeT (DUF2065 family)